MLPYNCNSNSCTVSMLQNSNWWLPFNEQQRVTHRRKSPCSKCWAISDNSPMIANNFCLILVLFHGLFLPGAFSSFLLLSIYCQRRLNIFIDFLLVKSFRMQNKFLSREKKQFAWDIQRAPEKKGIPERQRGGRSSQSILLCILKCTSSPIEQRLQAQSWARVFF